MVVTKFSAAFAEFEPQKQNFTRRRGEIQIQEAKGFLLFTLRVSAPLSDNLFPLNFEVQVEALSLVAAA
jgi:hypothetical protein